MGFGDFGSNRSVHWRQFIGDGQTAKPAGGGVDQKPYSEIGTGKGPKENHPGNFRVTARYETNAEARAALAAAMKRLDGNPDTTDVILDVRVRLIRDDPWNPAEVSVDW